MRSHPGGLGNPLQKNIVWEFKSILGHKEPCAGHGAVKGQRCIEAQESIPGQGYLGVEPPNLLGPFFCLSLPHLWAPPHIVCEDNPELPDLVLDIDGHDPVQGKGKRDGQMSEGKTLATSLACPRPKQGRPCLTRLAAPVAAQVCAHCGL